MTTPKLLLSALTFFGASHLSAAEPGSLPITRVVLYKHGIGYFERQGPVAGDATIGLRFKQTEMSDVLKTLTTLDRSGGAIDAIAYDSQKPPEMLLAEFAFDLRANDVQQTVLQQLRGATVTAEFAGRGTVTGSVLGLDVRVERVDGTEIKHPRLAVLSANGQIVSGDLSDLTSLKFDDPKLAADIARFLEVLRSTHRRDQRTVDLVCNGVGERLVFASYAVEQPVWKTTYRLVLEGDEKPAIQGWAVVDNTSDEDWTDVRLSLIAGLPISFRQDLYTPEFRARPELNVQEIAVAKVLVDRGGMDETRKDIKYKLADKTPGALRELGYVGGGGGGGKPGSAAMNDAFRAVESESMTREIGDLLEYAIEHPVTIPRNRSALLPIVAGDVEGGKVALYLERARANNAFSAVRVKNTTGLSLEGGPVTVLEGETYAGEAMLSSLKPNELRYIPYAVDLGLKATTQFDSKSERVYRVAFVNGVMITSRYQIETKTYSFDNKNKDARTVVVEHERRQGLELRAPQATETELDRYRFELAVPAFEKRSLAVVEAFTTQESFQIQDLGNDRIGVFLENGLLNAAAKQFLGEVAAARDSIAKIDATTAARMRELNEIRGDEERIRKNRQALGESADEKELVKLYVDQLRQYESRIQALSKELSELRAERDAKQAALESKLREFALEYSP